MIFCGTVCILYHNGNRLRLINRGLLFNLRLSTEYQKFKVDRARWHSWSKETRRAHVKKLPDYVPAFSDKFVKLEMLVENLDFLTERERDIENHQQFLSMCGGTARGRLARFTFKVRPVTRKPNLESIG